MSKKRPGVQAAVRLAASSDISLWERVDGQLDEVLSSVKNLKEKHDNYEALGRTKLLMGRLRGDGCASTASSQHNAAASSSSTKTRKKTRNSTVVPEHNDTMEDCCLSKNDLLEVIIPWKFGVGKPRPALMKYLTSNTNDSVQTHTLLAISKANDISNEYCTTGKNDVDDETNNKNSMLKAAGGRSHDVVVKEILGELTNNLKGVGPATASAILALVRPDVFCYMYDEVIDCFLPKRTYTLAVYMTIHLECVKISKRLSLLLSTVGDNNNNNWNPSRVARALWIAARIHALGGEDYTAVTEMENKKEVLVEAKKRASTTTMGGASRSSSSRNAKRRK